MTYRKIEVVRAAWGLALLLAPRWVLQNIHHATVDGKSLGVARILGARQVAQAGLSGVDPSPAVLALGAWVDAVHSASMIALTGVDRSRARAALTDAAVAGTWALLGYRDLVTAQSTSVQHERTRDRLAEGVLGLVPGGSVLRERAERSAR